MVKTIISALCVAILLIVAGIYERSFVNGNFKELNSVFSELYLKIDNETAVEEDVIAVQDNWLSKKKNLHAFIPHTEIKEIDLWLSEAVILVRDKSWSDALSKVEVLIELTEQIPKTFEVSFENVL